MSLTSIFQDIADAIRSKTGKSESIYPVDMASEIEGISSGGGYKLEKMPSGAVSSFNDGTDLPLNKLKVSIEPVQDLHGYDAPWAGGAGKNKLNNIASSITKNNVTFTVNSDGSVKVYSTGATSTAVLVLTDANNPLILQANKSYILSGCPNGGRNSTYELMLIATPTGGNALVHDYGSGVTIESSESDRTLGVQIVIRSGQVINDTFYPMIRLATETDATFAPYSNICPISGRDECNVNVSPTTSAEDGTTYTIQFKDGDNPLTVYGGTLDVTSGELTVTDAYIASYNAETLPSTWISDRDVYAEGTAPTTGAEVVYKLANSVTYHLTPVQIRTLVGNNNIWADTGDIINGEYFKGAGTQPTS